MLAGSSSQPPLSSIAERRTGSGDESEEEDEEDEEEGGWMSSDRAGKRQGSVDESVIKAGYLWKKGERRKVGCCTSPCRLITDSGIADLEEAVVRLAASPHCILQDGGRVPVAAAPGAQRRALMYAVLAQKSRQHVRSSLCGQNFLPPGKNAGRGSGVGQGDPRDTRYPDGGCYAKIVCGDFADTYSSLALSVGLARIPAAAHHALTALLSTSHPECDIVRL